jgi:hypothetical protein
MYVLKSTWSLLFSNTENITVHREYREGIPAKGYKVVTNVT